MVYHEKTKYLNYLFDESPINFSSQVERKKKSIGTITNGSNKILAPIIIEQNIMINLKKKC